MSTCPSGHQSAADDYCDVCGLPIPAGGATPPPPPDSGTPTPAPEPAAPASDASECPHCQAVNPANALFCEACGYDFTTGTMPRPATPSSLDIGLPPPAPTSSAPVAGAADPPTAAAAPVAPVAPADPLAPPLEAGWMAEVWIDPDWYADQDSDDPLPSAGVPTVVALRTRSILVGRTSRSRNIHPDIDLTTDTGISRRHCQFTTDGTRWWVEDLGSSNGTYVGGATGGLPQQPIPPGEKREIAPDDKIYLGAWTRIVIRKATPGEI